MRDYSIVGWVEVTKPNTTIPGVGFRYLSTQPTFTIGRPNLHLLFQCTIVQQTTNNKQQRTNNIRKMEQSLLLKYLHPAL